MKKTSIFFITFLSIFLFCIPSNAVSINVDQIIWEPDANLDPLSLSATVEFIYLYEYSFNITLTNTSTASYSPLEGPGFPSTVLLTGIGFNLPFNYSISGGDISGDLKNSTTDPGLRWGYDNFPLDSGPFQQGEATTKLVNTVVSTMESSTTYNASLVDGDAEFKGPDYGILSTAYDPETTSYSIPNKAYFLGSADITINLNGLSITDWDDFFLT